jgi:DNA-directed RNA polymerase subunit RPC12/RpoP
MERKTIKLNTITPQQAKNSTVLAGNGKSSVVFRGDGNLDYICGKCESIVAEGVAENQIKDVVFKCNKCGSYNDSRFLNLPLE